MCYNTFEGLGRDVFRDDVEVGGAESVVAVGSVGRVGGAVAQLHVVGHVERGGARLLVAARGLGVRGRRAPRRRREHARVVARAGHYVREALAP